MITTTAIRRKKKKEPQTFIKNCKITLKMFETYKNSNIRLHYNTKLNYFLFHLSSLCHRQIQQQNVINPPWLWIRCWLCVVGYSFFTWSRGRPLIKRRKKISSFEAFGFGKKFSNVCAFCWASRNSSIVFLRFAHH